MLESVGCKIAKAGDFGVTVDSSNAALITWFFVVIRKGEERQLLVLLWLGDWRLVDVGTSVTCCSGGSGFSAAFCCGREGKIMVWRYSWWWWRWRAAIDARGEQRFKSEAAAMRKRVALLYYGTVDRTLLRRRRKRPASLANAGEEEEEEDAEKKNGLVVGRRRKRKRRDYWWWF
ncbi:hypothetical protein AHAS_Ahas13G0456600 [Arachis hypogaea]